MSEQIKKWLGPYFKESDLALDDYNWGERVDFGLRGRFFKMLRTAREKRK